MAKEKVRCSLCGHGEYGDNIPECLDRQPGFVGLLCTRKEGHDGKHMGCGINAEDHPIDVWS